MIGLILLSHGPLAKGLFESTKFFIEDTENIGYLTLNAEDNPLEFQDKIETLIKCFTVTDGIILFTDIPGGSPANQAMQVAARHPELRLISGMNLIMIIEACLSRSSLAIDELCEKVCISAKESIMQIQINSNSEDNDMDTDF